MYLAIKEYTYTTANPYYPGPGDMNPTMLETGTGVTHLKNDDELNRYVERNRSELRSIKFYKCKPISVTLSTSVKVIHD